MKKAVIKTGGKQYLVAEGEEIDIELLSNQDKPLSFDALLVIDGEKIQIGAPIIDKVKINAEILENEVKSDKVTSIRFKAKKRVRTVRGHRQKHTRIKITKIA